MNFSFFTNQPFRDRPFLLLQTPSVSCGFMGVSMLRKLQTHHGAHIYSGGPERVEEVLPALPPSLQQIATGPLGQCALSFQKRVMDVALAIALLILLAPFMLCIALAVRLESPGPALFRQTRLGLCGRPFKILKFRTMRVMEDGPVIRQATPDDARTTRLGRILRKTSLDEIPQLFNVLLGDMSIVGPRPHAVAHDRYYATEIPEYVKRMTVKPGITGWAQVNGARGETPTIDHMRKRVTLDIRYVEQWSVSLDLVILVKTVAMELGPHKNVY
jgi:putative colanic acid biosysnthesis UDP-glucose lipid carrier transferase